MFDDLRKDAGSDDFTDDDIERMFEPKSKKQEKRVKRSGKFLGMTAAQRFVVSSMLFFATCLGGVLLLLVFERVAFF